MIGRGSDWVIFRALEPGVTDEVESGDGGHEIFEPGSVPSPVLVSTDMIDDGHGMEQAVAGSLGSLEQALLKKKSVHKRSENGQTIRHRTPGPPVL